MERLTFEGDFCDIAQCRDSACKQSGTCTQKEVWKRLKAEDTGLTPAEVHSMSGEWCAMMSILNSLGSYDRLRELAEADKDGRVVVQPFKVPSNLPYEEIVSRVEQWAKEHPVKTRQSEFLKMFPNARIESDGMPSICPTVVDKRCHHKDDDAFFCLVRDEEECRMCRRDFWLAEIS